MVTRGPKIKFDHEKQLQSYDCPFSFRIRWADRADRYLAIGELIIKQTGGHLFVFPSAEIYAARINLRKRLNRLSDARCKLWMNEMELELERRWRQRPRVTNVLNSVRDYWQEACYSITSLSLALLGRTAIVVERRRLFPFEAIEHQAMWY